MEKMKNMESGNLMNKKTGMVRIVMVKDHSFDFRPPWSTRSTGPRLARPVSEPWSLSPSAALRWWTLDTTGIPPGPRHETSGAGGECHLTCHLILRIS